MFSSSQTLIQPKYSSFDMTFNVNLLKKSSRDGNFGSCNFDKSLNQSYGNFPFTVATL